MESLTQEQSETKEQAEKDRSALLSQMRLLEAELEEQLSRQQACTRQAEELSALRQQMGSLDQHLRRQRQFMDVRVSSDKLICVTGGHLRSMNFFPGC